MSANGSVPAGTRVGRYEIVSLLRQGGMGEVYTAEDCNLGRRVALKILPRNRTTDPDRVARFVREARASSTLNHPSIVSVHDAGSEGDLHFLAMELIDGRPLSEWMRRRQSVAARVELMAQVADGLAQAHDAGIVHRDLKPDNVMVTAEGRAKIVDFGVAKLTERLGERAAVSGVTTPTSRVGTTAYMSPEQIEGRTLDHRTDVFSFGVVLYELMTGSNPFAASQYADTIHNIVHLEPATEPVPRELRRVVRRCLAKDPRQRYDSLRDAALDLRETVAEPEAPRTRLRRTLISVALLLVTLSAAAAWIVRQRLGDTGAPPRGMTMTRLTNSGRVTTAAISPDGNYLVHAVREGDLEALYVKQIATGTSTRIAEAAPRYHFNLSISADGNYAYYTAAERDEPNVAHVYQLPLLGGAARRIAADSEYWVSVSPDGTSVAFCRFNAFIREHQVTVAAVDGSGERVVARRKHPRFLQKPVWTPDGKALTVIAGNVLDKDEVGLFRLTLVSGAMESIPTPRFPGVGSYAWLPDGSGGLLTAYNKEQPPQIWFLPSGDRAGRKVTSEVSAYYGVTPTADSRTFSAVREVTDANIHMLLLGAEQPSVSRELTSGFGNWVGGGGVSWLNEKEVLFSAVADGTNTFYVVDANGGSPRRLIHNMTMWNVAVSPDGARIAFVSDNSGMNQIWVADSSGANARQVTRRGSVGWPSFTPDGRSIVFLSTDETQYAWRMPIDGNAEPVRLTDVPTSRVQVSPDGKSLLCRIRSKDPAGPLWRTSVQPLDGKAPARTYAVPRFGGGPILQWHPDGRSFLFVDFKDGVSNIWQQELSGGEPRQITFFPSGDIFRFDLDRDGRRLVIARGETTRDAVLVRDFR